ncbi:MAG: hypothetical protein IKP55_02710, partial [Clostridia bacterium]|nr:hypothetical protein [Clostridia bacterium]
IQNIKEIDRGETRRDIVEEVLEAIEPPGKQKRNPHGKLLLNRTPTDRLRYAASDKAFLLNNYSINLI